MTGAEIRAHRRRLGLYQVELAVIVGVRQATVSSWECGVYRPMPHLVRALETAFGLRAPDGACPMRPAGCGCRCHGRLPREEVRVLRTRRRTG